MQPGNITDDFSDVVIEDGCYIIDDWRISANLDPLSPATLKIENTRTGAILDMGTDTSVSTQTGNTHYRGYTSSTLIVDGTTLELVDEAQMGSRSTR